MCNKWEQMGQNNSWRTVWAIRDNKQACVFKKTVSVCCVTLMDAQDDSRNYVGKIFV